MLINLKQRENKKLTELKSLLQDIYPACVAGVKKVGEKGTHAGYISCSKLFNSVNFLFSLCFNIGLPMAKLTHEMGLQKDKMGD